MKKRLAAGLVLAVMAALVAFNAAFAAQAIKLVIKGDEVHPDVPAQLVGGRTLVPLRVIAEHLNEEVRWDDRTKTVAVAPDVWEQNVLEHLPRDKWVYARNVVLRFLMAFDEKDEAGKQLVSADFDTNLLGPEVVIPLPGVGSDEGTMVDFKFVDAWYDESAKDLTIRVKIWTWARIADERKERLWDFTIGMDRNDAPESYMKIKKVWSVDEKRIESHHVLPGLKFAEE